MTMRMPLRQPSRAQKAIARQVTAPVMGVNAEDSYDKMSEGDAVDLENWFPRESFLESRLGYTAFSTMTTATGDVQTLAEFNSGATKKFVAAGSGVIDDITTGTAANIGSGFSENRWQTEMFNARLFLVNGTDAPQDYDGTTLSATAWSGTGLTITDLIDVLAFKSRLCFVEKDSQSFWYGGLNAVTGTLTEFDLGQTGNFRGNLLSLQAITSDGGDGVDDLFVAMFSEGDVVIYQGSDPGSNFIQVGTFKIGRPLGQRAAIKAGSDVVVLTEDGYIQLTQVLPFGRVRTDQAFSERYKRVVQRAISSYKGNTGWEVIIYPTGTKLIVNVPVSSTRTVQHVMNTNQQAWTSFEYNDKPCTWGIYDGDLYFGTASGKIKLAENGFSDEGTVITSVAKDGWNYLGSRVKNKRWLDARPIFEVDNDLTTDIALLTDFDPNPAFTEMNLNVDESGQAIWDVAIWDQAVWAGGTQIVQDWATTSGVGYAGAIAFRVSVDDQQVRWVATTYVYEPGGII